MTTTAQTSASADGHVVLLHLAGAQMVMRHADSRESWSARARMTPAQARALAADLIATADAVQRLGAEAARARLITENESGFGELRA